MCRLAARLSIVFFFEPSKDAISVWLCPHAARRTSSSSGAGTSLYAMKRSMRSERTSENGARARIASSQMAATRVRAFSSSVALGR